jgi:hypothetical protein
MTPKNIIKGTIKVNTLFGKSKIVDRRAGTESFTYRAFCLVAIKQRIIPSRTL